MTDLDVKLWFEKYSGWILIWLFALIPFFIWLPANGWSSFTDDWYSTFSSLGKVLGLVGFVLYAINLLLAVRRKWLENFFQGLNRVYIAHHITGGFALAFLAFHPLFLALRSVDIQNLATFIPAGEYLLLRSVDTTLSFAEVQEALAINAGFIAFWGMVILLILTFFIKLPYRLWLWTHRFLGVAFIFAGLHIFFITSDTSTNMFLRYYLLAWTLIGLVAFFYRTVFGSIFVRRAPYEVTNVSVKDAVVGIELKPLAKPVTFSPGQFIFIRFRWSKKDGIISETHPFSIASGSDEDVMRLYVKALGDYTTSLANLKPGTVAEIEGAFGRFTAARYGTNEQVWIAGGIGITPFLSMSRSLAQTPQKITLIHSVNQRNELVEDSMLEGNISKHFSNFTYNPYIVAEQSSKYLDAQYIDSLVGGLAGKEIFLCGPPGMMNSLKDQMRKLGVKKSKIHSEEFVMT